MTTRQRLNLYVNKGTDWVNEVQLIGVNNQPVKIEGMKFQAFARLIYDERTTFLIDCTIIYSDIGVIHLTIPYERSRKIPPGEYAYNIEATLTSGRRIRMVEGSIFVSDDVTPDVIW